VDREFQYISGDHTNPFWHRRMAVPYESIPSSSFVRQTMRLLYPSHDYVSSPLWVLRHSSRSQTNPALQRHRPSTAACGSPNHYGMRFHFAAGARYLIFDRDAKYGLAVRPRCARPGAPLAERCGRTIGGKRSLAPGKIISCPRVVALHTDTNGLHNFPDRALFI
jgi:hypothetical protein